MTKVTVAWHLNSYQPYEGLGNILITSHPAIPHEHRYNLTILCPGLPFLLLYVIVFTALNLQLTAVPAGMHVTSMATLLQHFQDQTITEYTRFQFPSCQWWMDLCCIFFECLNFCICSNTCQLKRQQILPFHIKLREASTNSSSWCTLIIRIIHWNTTHCTPNATAVSIWDFMSWNHI